jgi:hypothetical protein
MLDEGYPYCRPLLRGTIGVRGFPSYGISLPNSGQCQNPGDTQRFLRLMVVELPDCAHDECRAKYSDASPCTQGRAVDMYLVASRSVPLALVRHPVGLFVLTRSLLVLTCAAGYTISIPRQGQIASAQQATSSRCPTTTVPPGWEALERLQGRTGLQ